MYLCLFALQLFVRTININSYYSSVCICSGIILYSTSNFRPCTIRFRFGRRWWGANVQHSAMSQCRRHALRHSARRRKLASLTFPVPSPPPKRTAHRTALCSNVEKKKKPLGMAYASRLWHFCQLIPSMTQPSYAFVSCRKSRGLSHILWVFVCACLSQKLTLELVHTDAQPHYSFAYVCAETCIECTRIHIIIYRALALEYLNSHSL